MDASSSVLRPRSLPKAGPETDLAEWTSRIKALQRQVDEDEETEQRKLEEEIAASRLARQRRSAMYGSPRATDLGTASSSSSSPLRTSFTSVPEDMKPIAERQRGQEDALQKLVGSSTGTRLAEGAASPPPPTPPSTTTTTSTPSSSSSSSRPPISKPKSSPISLAQFMGGRATGPRLNRHTPQQDAHDPTQFEQRTIQDIKAPHPVFGRGGVAMPGLAAKGRVPPVTPPQEGQSVRERRVSMPPVARRYVEKLEEQAVVVPQRTGGKERERTVSTPGGDAPLKRAASPQPEPVRRPISHSPVSERRAATPSNGRVTPSIPAPVKSPTSPTFSSTYATPPRPFTPAQSTTSITSSPSTPSKTPITTPSLARPKQPEPKLSVFGPQIVPSQKPSPAFLRLPPEKQPTPSLSRLKGRGFVQSMVKASSELTQSTAGSAPSSPTPVQGKGSGGKRMSNVLDRWPAASSSGASSPPPPVAPKPVPMRKSFTVDAAATPTPVREPQVIKPMLTGRSLRSTPSMPNISAKAKENDGSGLGSSNTMISYIKPVKTGDAPPLAAPPARPATAPPHEVDEMGVRVSIHRTGGSSAASAVSAGLPQSTGRPLSHPTKDRVKMRRKAKDGKPSKIETAVPAAIPEEEPDALAKPAPAPTTVPISTRVAPSVDTHRQLEPPESETPRSITPPSLKITAAKDETKEQPGSSVSATEGNRGRVTDRWTNGGVIGVKPVAPIGRVSPQPPSPQPKGMVGRQALPGLASIPPSSTPVQKEEPRSPVTARPKHARIPSTGNRATVMDVAQAFNEAHSRESSVSPAPVSPSAPEPEQLPEVESKPAPIPRLARPLPAPPLQTRKTSYDRYSMISLPPLEEESTPAPSPVGTLVKKTVVPPPDTEPSPTLVAEELKSIEKEEVLEVRVEEQQPAVVESTIPEPEPTPEIIHLSHVDDVLPTIDVQAVLKKKAPAFKPHPNDNTISVDVMTILGNTATNVQKESHVFYDTEVLAIIHRSKSKASGLVSTKVWGWCGKKGQLGEREERKLQELAKRYGTALERVQQYSEPAELVYVLGGRLTVRQGTREHWSSENTCMHLVRKSRGYIFIDEHDLNIKNLCSGFSYCLSILGTFYVWHGCGSLPQERQAAVDYARSISGRADNIVELVEGESDDDEMFWMILGDRDDYAKADHWRWRASSSKTDPRVWRVDAGDGKEPIHSVPSFTMEADVLGSVYVIDCIWEFFVLVGSEARGKRKEIRLALATATDMSGRTAASKPFTPAVHVVVLPTQLPLDLRLSFRDLDEESLNHGELPGHMHLLTVAEAHEQLQRSAWEKAKLQDHNLLPLGVDVSMLS